jgi:hypothetical protein
MTSPTIVFWFIPAILAAVGIVAFCYYKVRIAQLALLGRLRFCLCGPIFGLFARVCWRVSVVW